MRKKDRKFYDEAFMEVFTNKKIVKSLLVDFVHEDWVDLIDFSSMDAEKSVFKGIDDSKRETDLLLRFALNKVENENLFIFVLLEFQSTAQSMILRILEYITRIYKRQIVDFGQIYPVVPIVIYNGKMNWEEKRRFLNHFHIYPKDINKYIPDFEYILIDIDSFDDKILEQLKDSVSYFFLLDKTDLSKRDEAAIRIISILKKLKKSDPEIFNLLGRYISGLLEYKGVEINQIKEYIDNRGESMLAQSLDELYEDGINKGIEQGLEQGKLIEKQATLLKLLKRKFGITGENRELILSSNKPENLDDALDIILFANTIDEVLSVFLED